ncbi:hypothetical protein [Nocardioides sp. W7]|uniref:hypothetical protein n=1 Tax=Nocardioides sp. W7 TaxID=2931390 RepID=UPI001FD288C0|nr:hypothetical protein [Nocardioides sp. W7]
MSDARRLATRSISIPLAFAGLWSLGLAAGVGVAPMVSETTMTSDGATTSTTRTLVEEIGSGAYALAGLPLMATILIGCLSIIRPRVGPVVAAFVVVGALGIFNLLAMLSIGIFFVPATAALVVATCAMWARATSIPRPVAGGAD